MSGDCGTPAALWYIWDGLVWYPTGVWYMAGERTSVYLTAELAAAVRACGVPLAELVRRGLGAAASVPAQAQAPRPGRPRRPARPRRR